jgi:hypothetical protein
MEPNIIIYSDGDMCVYYNDINNQEFGPNLFLMAKNAINMIMDFFNKYTIRSIYINDKSFDEIKYMSDTQIIKKLKFKI